MRAAGANATSITHTGDINASNSGVYARSSGGGVTVNTTGNITSTGNLGIFAGDSTGAVSVTHIGNISAVSYGVYAITSGGGVTVNTTGNITSTGNRGIHARDFAAGAVMVTHSGGDINASDEGVFARSYGGGVTVNTTGNITSTGNRGIDARDTTGAVGVTHIGDIASSDTGIKTRSAGGGITVNTTGNITSTGNRGIYARDTSNGAVMVTHAGGNINALEHGVYARSTGGGVTVNTTGDITSTGGTGIRARDTSNGTVMVTHTGDITAGIGRGVYATSFSGGLTVITAGNITSANTDGIFAQDYATGAVKVTHTGGDISAANDGVSAQSSGGGVTVNTTGNITSTGGRGIYAGDTTGAVSVTHTGGDIISVADDGIKAVSAFGGITINTTGNITSTGGRGIVAQAFNGANVVTHQGGTVSGTSAGVRFIGGAGNILNNLASGTITSPGTAVQGSGGNETVNNFGTITGNVSLGAGANAFNNMAGGTFNSGATVALGAGNNLTNAGELSPGGPGVVQTTALSSNFIQTAASNTTVDINAGANTADKITATNITVAGTFTARLVNAAAVSNQTVTIATSTNAIVNNGPTLISPPAVQGQLAVNANNIQITYSVSFLGFGGLDLTPNQLALAGYINQIAGTGGAGLSTVLTALANLPAGAYQKALNQLGAESFTNLNFAALLSSLTNTDNLFSCPVAGGALAYIREGECLWIRPQARDLKVGNKASNPGFRETSAGVSVGAQVALSKDKRWHVGFSAGYQGSTLDQTGLGVTTRGDTAHGGVVVKYQWGATLISAGISGGLGWFENTRLIAFAGFGATAKSSFTQAHVTGRLRLAHLFRRRQFYLKPQVDLDVTWIRRGGFTETGAAGAKPDRGCRQRCQLLAPGPAWRSAPSTRSGTRSRSGPILRGGLTVFANNQHTVNASFAAAPVAGGFTTKTRFDRVFATVAAGVTVFLTDPGKQGMPGTITFRVEYNGRYSANARQHAISGKFSWKF